MFNKPKSMKKLITLLILITSLLILSRSVTNAMSDPADLLRQYEVNYAQFKEIVIGNKIVYFYQRMLDGAIVEKDFKVYHFDKKTGELIAKKTHWRTDLPEHLPQIKITKEQAETMVKGQVQFTELYIISPESDVFPIKPTPKNPCWIVRSIDKGDTIVTIIDGVEGKILGYGVSPPYTAFSLTGPVYSNPCSWGWDLWYLNAKNWFNTMGYNTEAVQWPTETIVKSHIQSTQTAMFYELAHGGSYGFASGCLDGNSYETTYASEIEAWITNYYSMPFVFIGSCGGMCDVSDGSLSYEFRKGSVTNTATTGYCDMAAEKCSLCWTYSVSWQDALFNYMNQSWTVKAAFDQAQTDYPACAAPNNCMRFVGDENFTVVPVVERGLCNPDRTSGDGLCDKVCGASLECEGRAPSTKWCDGNTKKVCNSTCQYSYEDCRTDAEETDGGKNYSVRGICYDYDGCKAGECKVTSNPDYCYYSYVQESYVSGSFCAYTSYNCKNYGLRSTCSDGKCESGGGGGCPILKVWDGEKFVDVEKLNIHAPRDQDTTYASSFSMRPINGKYEIILDEAAYLFWDGSHIDSVSLRDEAGKECKLISAIHSKQGDVLKSLQKSDDIRVRTFPGEEIKLVYEGCSGNQFTFTIEGYNMKIPLKIPGPRDFAAIGNIFSEVFRWISSSILDFLKIK